jgi:hypothetical protein
MASEISIASHMPADWPASIADHLNLPLDAVLGAERAMQAAYEAVLEARAGEIAAIRVHLRDACEEAAAKHAAVAA